MLLCCLFGGLIAVRYFACLFGRRCCFDICFGCFGYLIALWLYFVLVYDL